MLRIVLIVLLTSLMGACSSSPFYHKVFMRGQVVGVDGDQVVFCIGTETGASIGESSLLIATPTRNTERTANTTAR